MIFDSSTVRHSRSYTNVVSMRLYVMIITDKIIQTCIITCILFKIEDENFTVDDLDISRYMGSSQWIIPSDHYTLRRKYQ